MNSVVMVEVVIKVMVHCEWKGHEQFVGLYRSSI